MELVAREASQVLGGASCIRGGKGERIERLYREGSHSSVLLALRVISSQALLTLSIALCAWLIAVRIFAIGGGSEEVLRDLAVRPIRAKL